MWHMFPIECYSFNDARVIVPLFLSFPSLWARDKAENVARGTGSWHQGHVQAARVWIWSV